MTWHRTIRARIALSIAAAVLGSAVTFAVSSGGAFYLHERAETQRRHRSPERQAKEDHENLLILLRMAGGMAIVLPFAVAGSAAVGFWLSTRALAPMREAVARAKRARSGRSSSGEPTLPVRGTGDEWDELASVVNELLREQQESIAREKTFSANAAHELRTPLTAMLGEVQVALRRERSASELRSSLEVVETDVKRLAALVDALLTLARADAGQLRAASVRFDLAEVARAAAGRARRVHARASVEVDAPAISVLGDPLLTGRILDNLIDNALRHGASRVEVDVARRGARATTRITDDGPGLPPDVRARLFERFNKAAGAGEGFGLGLALAHAFTVAQDAMLRLDTGSPRTSFVLEMPIDGAELHQASTEGSRQDRGSLVLHAPASSSTNGGDPVAVSRRFSWRRSPAPGGG